MVRKAHFPYGHYSFQDEGGLLLAASVPTYTEKKIQVALEDLKGKVILNAVASMQRIPEHGGLILYTVFCPDGGIVGHFVKPSGWKLIGQEHYEFMTGNARYLALDDTKGNGEYVVTVKDTSIATVETLERHLRMSRFLIRIDGTIDLNILMETLILANLNSAMDASMLLSSHI